MKWLVFRVALIVLVVFTVYSRFIKPELARAKAEETRICGVVKALLGPNKLGMYVVMAPPYGIEVPTRQAYERLEVGKEYTFYMRKYNNLVALEPGNHCGK